MLKAQSTARISQQKNQRAAELEEAKASTGFEFECFTRDQIMKDERQNIKKYQEGQKDYEKWKKHMEKQETRKGNPLAQRRGQSTH